jgi:hypothetical protein
MRIESWWIFYGSTSFKMSIDNAPAKFSNPETIDQKFVEDFMAWMVCERREAGFMAMGLGASIARAKIVERKAVVIDGVEYVPEGKGIIGNGFAFTWLV